ncbi:MAG TPA: rhomboid family intramembrane serine protease [Longimicrobiaceae bacterium]
MSRPNPQATPGPAETARVAVVLGPKPPDAEYGYFDGTAHASTREELVGRLREGRPTPYVWTPETEGVVHVWAVPWLFAALRERRIRHARRLALIWAAISLALLAYAVVFRGTVLFIDPFVLASFVAASLSFYSWLEWGRFRRLTPERLADEARQAQERLPPRRGPARYTQALAACIAAVVLVQAASALWQGNGIHIPIAPGSPSNVPSIEAAGVVKEYVRSGEWWRLLTGAFLHDGLLHFGMNVLALLAIGRFLEAFAHRAYIPLVFLLSALAASATSYFFSYAEASVGASGGLLGLFGFLAVLARVRRRMMPPGFGRAILADIGVIAAMGIFGAGYIDNAAHAGGFVAGAALGWLMIPRSGRTPYWEPSRPIRTLGDISLGILVAATAGTIGVLIWRVFLYPMG